jgi:hypothetical protein
MSLEDDTYNTMFTALKHPIRRRILRILGQTPTAYTEIQTQLGIDNGLLNYHLENMKDLLTKGDEGKYSLSEFGRAALGVTEKVESPAVGKRNGLSGNKQIGIILILTIAVASLSGLSYQVYNSYMSQGVVLYEKTAELDEATRRLNTLIPFGELANVSEPATYWTDGVSIVNGFPMTVTYRFGGSDGLHDEYYDTTAIIVFYVPVNGSVVRLNLVVDPVNVYDLDLTLQGGNAWRNETLLDLGTVAEYYNRTEINEWTLKHIWQAPIVWSMKTHGNGVIETTSLAKGWYTLSMFGPITFTGSGDGRPNPMFKGIFPWGRIGLNGLPIDSYRAYIDLLIMKAGEPSFFAVTTARS